MLFMSGGGVHKRVLRGGVLELLCSEMSPELDVVIGIMKFRGRISIVKIHCNGSLVNIKIENLPKDEDEQIIPIVTRGEPKYSSSFNIYCIPGSSC